MVGGYQIIDFKGLNVIRGETYPLVDGKIANILRNSNKPIYFINLIIDGGSAVESWLSRAATGAYDGTIYLTQIGPTLGTISTNGDIVSILVND